MAELVACLGQCQCSILSPPTCMGDMCSPGSGPHGALHPWDSVLGRGTSECELRRWHRVVTEGKEWSWRMREPGWGPAWDGGGGVGVGISGSHSPRKP